MDIVLLQPHIIPDFLQCFKTFFKWTECVMCLSYHKDTLGLCIFKPMFYSTHVVDFSTNTWKCPLRNWVWHAMFYLPATSCVGFARAVNF